MSDAIHPKSKLAMAHPDFVTRLLQLSRNLAHTTSIDALLTLAVSETRELINAQLCYIVLLDDDDELDVRAKSIVVDFINADNDPMSRSIFDQVTRNGESLYLTDALSDDLFASHTSIIELQIRSVMCVPLIMNGNAIGALYAENRKITDAFRQNDLDLLTMLANQIALSIENALIIGDLEDRVDQRTRQLEQSWHDAIEANRMRTLLLGQLSHDLRSSATIVSMSLSRLLLQHGVTLDDQQKRLIKRAEKGLHQMTNLVSNIFDLTKMETNGLEINTESVALKPFLERIYDIALGLIWREVVTVELAIPDEMPTIMFDPVRIQQVLINLLANAAKFTDEGTVTIHATVHPDHITIGVRDTGTGIAPENLDKIFERYLQLDEDRTRRATGAGLGLAISKELVELHGGRIWVTSTPAEGSDFIFSLPL